MCDDIDFDAKYYWYLDCHEHCPNVLYVGKKEFCELLRNDEFTVCDGGLFYKDCEVFIVYGGDHLNFAYKDR